MTALPRTVSDDPAEIASRIARGVVYCTRCPHERAVDGAECLEKGWPLHCRSTMSIDTPAERSAYFDAWRAKEGRAA
jgi:hypothetical protein